MMQSCTSFGAGGSSQQVMGAHQGWAALLGCSQSAPGGSRSLLPTAPHILPKLKGPANETSPVPPHVDHGVQELMAEVERAIQVCLGSQNYDGCAALKKGMTAIQQTVDEIAMLDANLAEYKRVDDFVQCATTKRELNEAVTKLNQQKDAVRNTLSLSQLF